ncbi:MAG TPA: THUMP domain-containing protein [Rhodothermales bacterium]|nr:THUMP domain-containing protein [Rhodothermales bacterium]
MYQYQQTRRFFAQIAGGLEETGKAELADLGATDIAPAYRGLYFDADDATLYRINYQTRLLTRVLAPLLTFDCHSDRYLYKTARSLDWTDFLSLDTTFAIFANVSHSKITHSKYAALRLKDAIVDDFRDRTGKRPSIDTRNPDVWLNLHIENNQAIISLDTSGGSLHRRGYRTETGDAPMQETVAAAAVRFSGWNGENPLYDPMCGAGTLLAEALMHYANIPSGYLRDDFGFAHLPDFDAATWQAVKAEADSQIRSIPPGLLGGSDIDPDAVAAARTNLHALPGGEAVNLEVKDFHQIESLENVTILSNPPYGLRMGREEDMSDFYQALGDFLKQRCTGSTAYLYFGKREWIKSIGLRASWKKPLVHGSLDGRLVKYEMY